MQCFTVFTFINDKYIDPQHARLFLNAEGFVSIEDLGSLNGTQIMGKKRSDNPQTLDFNQVISLGDTRLTLVDPAQSVSPAAQRSIGFRVIERFRALPALIGLTLAAFAIDAAITFSRTTSQIDAQEIGTWIGSTVAALLLLVLMMSVFSRLTKKISDAKGHWVYLMLCSLVFASLSWMLPILHFNWSNSHAFENLSVLIYAVFGTLISVGFLSYASYLSTKLRWVLSILVSLTFVVSSFSDDWGKEPHQLWSDRANEALISLPPDFLWVTPASVSDYQAEVERLFSAPDPE